MSTGCLILLSAACLNQAVATSKTPTAADLIKLAPVIKSAEGKYRTIEVSGFLKEPGQIHLRYHAAYRALGDFSCLISDGADGTPLVYSTSRESLIYDPVGPGVIHSKNRYESLHVAKLGKVFGFGLAMEVGKPKFGVISVDLRPLFDEPSRYEVVDTGDRTYRLNQIYDVGQTTVYYIDLKQKCPFTGMKFYAMGSHEATVGIDRIVLDAPVGDAEFRFPDVALLADRFVIHEESDVSMARVNGDVRRFDELLNLRSALHHPAARASIPNPQGRPIPWDRIKATDEQYSAAFKAAMDATRKPPERSVVAKPPAR